MAAGEPVLLRALLVVVSYHHGNTEKIARAMAGVLGADVVTPEQVLPERLYEYDLVGFGSGIYAGTFDPAMTALADRLSFDAGKRCFLFSTYGAPAFAVTPEFTGKNHEEMRQKLAAKGYAVLGEFGCAGWNTNSFLNYFGGINRGRPDAGDLRNAEAFAEEMAGMARAGTKV